MRRRTAGLLFASVLAAHDLAAQPPEGVTLPGTELRRITSEHNGVDYKIYVALPNGYAAGERRYGVVYTLDADYSFAIARNVIEHLSDRNHLEPLIVVSIAYEAPSRYRLDRTRDYTPTHTLEGGYGPEMQKHSGGGPKFRDFLIEELVPFIDRTYRTDSGKRALAGHSYGGLFTTWVMLTTGSTSFNRFIIVSPSLWYDDGMIFEVMKNAQPAGRVYLAAGALENPVMAAGVRRLAGELRKPARAGLAIRHEILEGETHNSIFPAAFSRGLRWAFGGR
ncbi:MAG TPA: alpha/beta hydrolase-fold protein [Thermoanaerobaculia bacterium]|nr:alpha/beta hydrolase-fold protein [Thermoanaerobaculia bacterium]